MLQKMLLVLLMLFTPPGACACFAHHQQHDAGADQVSSDACHRDCDHQPQNHHPDCPSFKPFAEKLFSPIDIQSLAIVSWSEASIGESSFHILFSAASAVRAYVPGRPLFLTHCTFVI
ncbi:MAG: hypothetical protein HYX68_11120 [Planctomycetes bacterium]|nr:hypothetical protein [Planctomycetota bacterium]